MASPDREPGVASYAEYSQVGMLMAVPIGIGALVDRWQDWTPWATAVGATLGLTSGLFTLIRLVNRERRREEEEKRGQRPPP